MQREFLPHIQLWSPRPLHQPPLHRNQLTCPASLHPHPLCLQPLNQVQSPPCSQHSYPADLPLNQVKAPLLHHQMFRHWLQLTRLVYPHHTQQHLRRLHLPLNPRSAPHIFLVDRHLCPLLYSRRTRAYNHPCLLPICRDSQLPAQRQAQLSIQL